MTAIIIIVVISALIPSVILLYILSRMRGELTRVKAETAEQFRNITNESLLQGQETLKRETDRSLSTLLTPVARRLDDFNRAMARQHTDAESSRRSLADQLERMNRLNLMISREARNLSDALRNNTRVQGEWGETLLVSLLEKSGLKRDINFNVQATRNDDGSPIKDAEGKPLRPDVIINLPDARNIIIDSKTSLTAYLDYCESADDAAADEATARHLSAIKRHIDTLGSKAYQKHVRNAAEQVIMFIPNDSALLLAHQTDSTLWEYAMQRNVSIVGPSTLIATVQIIAQIWRKEYQDRNTAEIARTGGLLYDSVAALLSDLQLLGRQLQTADKTWNGIISRIDGGSQSITARANRLRDLGAKTTRHID